MNEKIKQLEEQLKKLGIQHEFISLPESLPLDVASHVAFHRIIMKDAVPTLIYKTEKGLIAIQRRADTKFDIQKLKKFVGVKRLEFASSEDLKQLETEVGIVPLIGLPIPYFVDQKVLDRNEIYGGSGVKIYALKMHTKDLVKVNKATVGDFTDAANKKRVYSGIRATGRLHLGNYMGAVKGMLALQDTYDCIFSVVDLHAMTTPYDPKTLRQSIQDIILDYLAAGLNPDKCLLEVQSHIPQHTELSYLLSTIYPLAQIEDLPTYKEKKAQHPKYVNVGLLYYPVLMAADILLYKGELVPVGIDQEPHLEVAREIARKFNSVYGQTFPEPKRFATPGEYIPSLTGSGKMGKSIEGSYITLADDFETLQKRIAKVPTDSGVIGGSIPTEGGVANLFKMLRLFASGDVHHTFVEKYRDGTIRYSELKKVLSEEIYKELQPLQQKRKYFENHPEVVDKILAKSRDRCLKIASETMNEVKEKMGLL